MRCEAVPVILDGVTGCPVLYAGSLWKYPSPVSLAVPKKSSVHIYGVDQMPLARMDGLGCNYNGRLLLLSIPVRPLDADTSSWSDRPTDRPAREGGRE